MTPTTNTPKAAAPERLGRLASRLRRGVLLVTLLLVTAVVLPPATVRDAPAALVKVDTATGVAHRPNVVWVLLLGSDARRGQAVLRSRADAIQLVGVNLRTGASTVIGIPRDSYVPVPGYGRDKINAAMVFGGPQLMARAVGDMVGIRPDYVFTTSFLGFQRMVNAIGGIEVDSKYAFSDGDLAPRGFKRGRNKLNGFEAMAFSRIRKSLPGGDFDRSGNQQRTLRGILGTVRARADQRGFMERGVASVLANLDTPNVSPVEAYELAQAATQLRPVLMRRCVIRGSGGYAGAASVVFPDLAQARSIARRARGDATLEGAC